MRLIVGISGASGVILGYEMLKALKLLPGCMHSGRCCAQQ